MVYILELSTSLNMFEREVIQMSICWPYVFSSNYKNPNFKFDINKNIVNLLNKSCRLFQLNGEIYNSQISQIKIFLRDRMQLHLKSFQFRAEFPMIQNSQIGIVWICCKENFLWFSKKRCWIHWRKFLYLASDRIMKKSVTWVLCFIISYSTNCNKY